MKIKYNILLITYLCFSYGIAYAQEKIDPNGYNIFYHPNGKIYSEGNMRDGRPDGYWKTYYDDGTLKSEGNRVDFELDSLWKFYNENGNLVLEVSYRKGKKEGNRKTYREDEIIIERFENDQKEGITEFNYADGSLKRTIPFENGLEEGNGFDYDKLGNIITLTEYRRGFIVHRESVNRTDNNGLKQGRWKYFYEDGLLMEEGTFRNDKKDGFFKKYDRNGNLLELKKYVDGEEVTDAPEISKLKIIKEYYENGKVSSITTYRNGLPEGVSREYASDGSIKKAIIYAGGNVIGRGIMDENGIREGEWEEFYISGKLRAKGNYTSNIKTGEWVYYHENGLLEQKGEYNIEGKPVGTWIWYYNNGNLWREEFFINGLRDGLVIEYDSVRNIISEGEYFEGLEEGKWMYNIENHKIEGVFGNGKRNGIWKHYYPNGVLGFEGQFIDDNPNGKHIYYWEDGKVKDEENYIMGRKEGDWIRYNDDGTPFIIITYSNNREIRYDGIKIKPEYDE